MRANIHQILSDGDTGPLLGGRIWGGRIADQGTATPYASWYNRFTNPDNALENGIPCAIGRTFQISVYSTGYAFLRQAEAAIIDDIAEHGYITNISDGWDSEVKLYRLDVDVSIFDN